MNEYMEIIEWELEKAKESPMVIHHDFDTRYQVWTERILPNRLNSISRSPGDIEYLIRMIEQTVTEANMLKNRAIIEESEPNCISNIQVTLTSTINKYIKEVRK